MPLSATSVASLFLVAGALPAFALAWWLSRNDHASRAMRMPWRQRRIVAIHMLLVGLCLMGCGVALHFTANNARTGVGIAIAALVIVNALGISLWLRLSSLRKRSDASL